jgi:hypothetical protein
MIASVSPASMLGGLPNITALQLLKVWVLLAPEECPPLLAFFFHKNKDA